MTPLQLAMWSAALLAAPSPAVPVAETRCHSVLPGGERLEAPDIRVIEATRQAGRFEPGLPAGAAIICGRSSIVPAPDDWKVTDAGHPLLIIEASGADEPRIGTLEVSTGRYRYRLIRGRLTPAEAEQVTERLNVFQLSGHE